MFIEGADIPNIGSSHPYKIKESIRSPSPNQAVLTHTTTTYQNGNHLPSNVLRELEYNRLGHNNPDKSTLVIHSVQRVSFNYF